jgi:hypothetical protein
VDLAAGRNTTGLISAGYFSATGPGTKTIPAKGNGIWDFDRLKVTNGVAYGKKVRVCNQVLILCFDFSARNLSSHCAFVTVTNLKMGAASLTLNPTSRCPEIRLKSGVPPYKSVCVPYFSLKTSKEP